MKVLKKSFAAALALTFVVGLLPTACAAENAQEDAHVITLSSAQTEDGSFTHAATLDGAAVAEYDYTWNVDPTVDHGEVKNAPAEYYTGTAPSGEDSVYIAHDIFYFPELPQEDFVLVNRDGDTEWAYYYPIEGYEEYIFGTLPAGSMGFTSSSFPTQMMHSAQDAYQNAVLHITQAGTYILEGEWHGQIWIDLGDTDDTFTDENAKVTVILNGVDVTCTVASALVFYSVYECDNTWEDRESYSATVDTANAGANVIIADGTVNNFEGTNIYRMYKTTYKKDGVTQKKQRKVDGAFYSYVSMNIDGGDEDTGVLNITSGFEGLDTELHLTINGGNVRIFSQDDGINVNEDGVSVVTFNGGSTHILAGLGSEGDGVDSNGFLVVNGGTVISMANPRSDSGLDSDCGSYVNGGTVVALGSTMDWAEADDSSEAGHVTMNLRFSSSQSADEAIIITDAEGNVVFAYDPDKDEVAGSQVRWYQGAVISCESLEVGESYYVYVGGDVYGDEVMGIYDVSTVTGFSEDAKRQGYTGTDGFGFGFGGFGGMMGGDFLDNLDLEQVAQLLPEGVDLEQIKQLLSEGGDFKQILELFPDDFDFSQFMQFLPGGFDFDPADRDGRGDFDFTQMGPNNRENAMDNGMNSEMGERPQRPDDMGGMTMPDGGNAPAMPNGEAAPAMPEGGETPAMPEGMEIPAMPEGMEGGFMGGGRFDGMNSADADAQINGVFTMTDKVNSFSGVCDYTEPDVRFSDVTEDDWYYDAAQYVSEKGLMSGTSAGAQPTFSPMQTIDQGSVVTILARMNGVDTSGEIWYQAGMDWAAEAGISTESDPAHAVTREELAGMLYRCAQSQGKGFQGAWAFRLTYTDLDQMSDEAYEAVAWCTMNGVFTGKGDGSLDPQGVATRAELAAVLMRLCQTLEQ